MAAQATEGGAKIERTFFSKANSYVSEGALESM
jgi:hypothetical protein